MSLHHGVDLLAVWSMDFQSNPIMLLYLVHELIRCLGQAAGVNGENPHSGINPARHINNHQAIGLETGTDRYPAPKAFKRPADYILRLLIVELNGKLTNLKLIQHDVSFHVHSFPLLPQLFHGCSCGVLSFVTSLSFTYSWYSSDSDQLLIGAAVTEFFETLPFTPALQIGLHQPFEAVLYLGRRDPAQHRLTNSRLSTKPPS